MSRRTPQAQRVRLVVLGAFLVFAALLSWTPPNTTSAQPASVQKISPILRNLMAAEPSKSLPIIVEMNHATPPFPRRPNEQLAQRALNLIQLHGQPVGALTLIDSAAGFATSTGIIAISLNPNVAFIHYDTPILPAGDATKQRPAVQRVQFGSAYPQAVKADQVWAQGVTGKGITVAVLDSGVARDPDLTQRSNRLLAAVNFAGDRGGLDDAGGHGTHIAGIIAGNGTRSAREYVGIAPQASVVDVRVLNSNGNGRFSSVIRGIEWVLAHRTQYNIRVINLSFGAPANTSYRVDPLTAAVEIAWKRGMVVIAAAGNNGPNRNKVDTPGIDPYAITIGATDDRGTATVTDDELAFFSSWGTPTASTPKPDIVAPGLRIVSLRVTGSFLDRLFPDRVVTATNGAAYFRLTGTSAATAVASGAAALLLERQPSLTPDQVKALLVRTTQPYGQASRTRPPDPLADGNGLIDAYTATNSQPRGAANQDLRPSDAFARTLYPLLYGRPLVWKDPLAGGINWAVLTWQNLAWDNLAWDNLAWDSFEWNNLAWDNLAWDNLAWDNLAWDRAGWDNLAWDDMTLD